MYISRTLITLPSEMPTSCNAISLYLPFNEIITTSWFCVRWLIAANLIHRRLWCLYKWNKNERWTSCMWLGIGRCLISKTKTRKLRKWSRRKTKHNLMTSPAIGVSNCWNCFELMAVVSYLFLLSLLSVLLAISRALVSIFI